VAGSLGYCGLDRRRQPLAGDEIRECWEARPGGADLSLAAVVARGTAAEEAAAAVRSAPLDFIEVHGRLAPEPVGPSPEPSAPSLEPTSPGPDPAAFVPPPGPPSEPGWNLWGDLDR